MGKRLIDLFIVLIILAALGIGGYFAYDTFLADDGSGTDESSGGSGTAQVIDSTLQLPLLDETQLTAILPTADDLPPALRAAQPGATYTLDFDTYQQDVVTALGAEMGAKFGSIRAKHNLRDSLGIQFDACTVSQDVAQITVEVNQFDSTAAARAFIDDPAARGFFQAMGYTLTEADDVHGFYLMTPMPVRGTCFPENEWETVLLVDHWGLLFSIQVTTSLSAGTDAGRSVVDALAANVIANVEQLDILTGITIPPTPVPAELTFEDLLSADVTPTTLIPLLPSPEGWSFFNIYTSDDAETLSLSLTELVALYNDPQGLAYNPQLAAAIDRAGRRYGLIAREIRAYKPETPCPTNEPMRIDVTLSLFERPAGARAYMQDSGVQNAWLGTNLFNEFVPVGDVVYAYGSLNRDCGPMQIVQKSANFERLLYTISITMPASVPPEEAKTTIDAMLAAALRNAYIRGL